MAYGRVDDSCQVLPALEATILGRDGRVIRHADGRLGHTFSRGRPRPARRARRQAVRELGTTYGARAASILKWTVIVALACVGIVALLVVPPIAKDLLAAAGLGDGGA